MDNVDLSKDDLAILNSLFDAWAKDYQIWVYGSRAKGLSHSGSDLDLIVYNPQNPDLSFPELAELRQALRESDLPFLVDIFDWSAVPQHFKSEILKNKVILYPHYGVV